MPTDQLHIIWYPDPVLRRKARPVVAIDARVRAVAKAMLELMHEAGGVGLAAPQVGLSWRLFVANPTGDPQDDRVFINPVLSDPSKEAVEHEEGCLSIPEVRANILRPKAITVTATDLDGKSFSLTSDDLAARVWQHEYDHLDGVLILDRMQRIDRLASRQMLKELEDSYEATK
ncbi:MAG: peptide deformylase [Phycisphaeraceae bacterium]|nr:peptide deformylase [Phycisphaeraceae bacterium]